LKFHNYPGLAMSRSIGDLIASEIGVTCEPGINLMFIVYYLLYFYSIRNFGNGNK
jgi:hypothetical protein